MQKTIYLLFFICLVSCQNVKIKQTNLSPELQNALNSLEIMEGFEIEMLAAEPLIRDPVAMEIDENGDLYVLEMPGYPLDLNKSGRVKKLIDSDHDGIPDKSIIFADGLTLPMGLMKWKKGILVADAPDIFYLEDTDGDGKADIKEVMLTGFSLSNPQHNMNTPKFGLDNWIYVGHSGAINSFAYEHVFNDKGEEIHFPNVPDSPRLLRNADGRNVRFKPESHELEILSGETQYGHTTDPWGHRFYTDNANHLFHEVIDARYINNNPNLAIHEAMQKFSDHGNACEVFPITENPNHQLLTDVGMVTSSCGITWYDGGAFGKEFENITLIGEPVHNLVHIDYVEENGATFTGKRVLDKEEFLASRDPWFRPVFFYVGPDGALYVVDYYRQIVEHPEWLSEEVNESGALYEGSDKGRIYRITPKGGLPSNWLNSLDLGTWDSAELVDLLKHQNGWYRKTAQRLLYQRDDRSISNGLHEIVNSNNSKAIIPALWLLHDWNEINSTDLLNAFNSPQAGVRENALQVTDKLWGKPGFELNQELENAIRKLAIDPNARVRFQWLCSAAFFDIPGINQLKSDILKKDISDPWVGVAAIASSKGSELSLFKNAVKDFGKESSEGKAHFFAQLAGTLRKKGEKSIVESILAYSGPENSWWQSAMLIGLTEAGTINRPLEIADKEAQRLLAIFLNTESGQFRQAIIAVLSQANKPLATEQVYEKMAGSEDDYFVGDALALLAALGDEKVKSKIINTILNPGSEKLRLLALQALPRHLSSSEYRKVNEIYGQFTTPEKEAWIAFLIQTMQSVPILIKQVEDENIPKKDLRWPQIVRLMNYYDTDIRQYARSVFAINEDRKAVLQKYLPAAEMKGSAGKGEVLFKENCSVCHQLNGENGFSFGPDLATLKSRNSHSIITEIINPNNSIADKYGSWIITLKNGQIKQGIISNETESSISMRFLGGNTEAISKSQIEKQEISKNSLMPNGLENNINLQEMADLLALIKGL